MSLSRFKGALLGAVVGDCVGAHFEGIMTIKMSEILSYCDKLNASYQKKKGKGTVYFTDDTAMSRSVMSSLLEHREFNAEDMAIRFAEQYYKEPQRGYGGNIVNVFSALTEPGIKDVFQPAREQFDGSGSYGNGGAMRIAPAPLFAFHKNDAHFLEKLASQITRLTHSHHLAIHGAVLQAFAVDKSLRLAKEESINCNEFCDDLISVMKPIETGFVKDKPLSPKRKPAERELDDSPLPYCAKLEKIKEFVSTENLAAKTVEKVLGNDISAVGSVPAAVLAFLRGSTRKIPGLDEENPFKRVILYAISLGGDTDTIATMAGAMAGAFYGVEAVPEDWRYLCEGVDDAEKAAEIFFSCHEQPQPKTEESTSTESCNMTYTVL